MWGIGYIIVYDNRCLYTNLRSVKSSREHTDTCLVGDREWT